MFELFTHLSIQPYLATLIPALLIFHYALSKTPGVQNWVGNWLLIGAGILACTYVLGANFNGFVNGMILAAFTMGIEHLYKQLKK